MAIVRGAALLLMVGLAGCEGCDQPSSPVQIPVPPASFVGNWHVRDTALFCDPFSPRFSAGQWVDSICSEAGCLEARLKVRMGRRIRRSFAGPLPFTLTVQSASVTDSTISMIASVIVNVDDLCETEIRLTSMGKGGESGWVIADQMYFLTYDTDCGVAPGDTQSFCGVVQGYYTKEAMDGTLAGSVSPVARAIGPDVGGYRVWESIEEVPCD